MNWQFFSATLVAGIVAGAVNFFIARWIVHPRLDALSGGMKKVGNLLVDCSLDEDQCKHMSEKYSMKVDSDDEIGETAEAFNYLLNALSRAHQLEAVYHRFNSALTGTLDLDHLAQEALEMFMEYSGADGGCILSVHKDEKKIVYQSGMEEAEKLLEQKFLNSCMKNDCMKKVTIPPEVSINAGVLTFRPQEVLMTPLNFKKIPLGLMILASGSPFKQDTEKGIDLLKDSLGLAMNNAITHENLHKIAALDGLTGAYNRRFGMQRFSEEIHRCKRFDSHLGILMYDLDHFKAVNDTYGHLMGDRVLKTTSEAIRTAIREGDILIRWGGEEFLLLLPGATKKDTVELGERFRRIIADVIAREGDAEVKVTASFGAASFPEIGVEKDSEIIKEVDDALYTAKEQGRNRLVAL